MARAYLSSMPTNRLQCPRAKNEMRSQLAVAYARKQAWEADIRNLLLRIQEEQQIIYQLERQIEQAVGGERKVQYETVSA